MAPAAADADADGAWLWADVKGRTVGSEEELLSLLAPKLLAYGLDSVVEGKGAPANGGPSGSGD